MEEEEEADAAVVEDLLVEAEEEVLVEVEAEANMQTETPSIGASYQQESLQMETWTLMIMSGIISQIMSVKRSRSCVGYSNVKGILIL